MNLWSVEHFLTIFVITLGWVCCCTHPKAMTKMAKKCSTDQRFIPKRNTTYQIHTLDGGGVCFYSRATCHNKQTSPYSLRASTVNSFLCQEGSKGAFNNYANQILRNFDPLPPSSVQTWTFYILFTLCHMTPRGLSIDPLPPLLVDVLIECPLIGY